MNKIAFTSVSYEDRQFFSNAFTSREDVELHIFKEDVDKVFELIPADCEVICVSHTAPLDADAINHFVNLKLIVTRSTGFNHIDVAHAATRSVVVSNVPAYGENTVAEYAFTILLALLKKLPLSLQQTHSGRIDYQELRGRDLSGLTFGIIGTGRIGRHAARMARGFDMRVIGFDPFPNYQEAEKIGLHYMDFDSVLREADVVSLHAPLTEDNRHMINQHTLSMMKNSAVLVNTARGELIKTSDLINALVEGKIAGAALDVVEGEAVLNFDEEVELFHKRHDRKALEMALEHELLDKMDNVIFTPHNAFNTVGALERIRHTSVENINSFLAGEVVNVVQ